jgi:hypothetical protein
LTLYTVVGVAGAMFLPKYLMGQVYVFPVRSEMAIAQPLAPASSNITQSAYLTISLLTAISFAVLSKKRNFLNDFKIAIIAFAAGIIITGILEYALGIVGQSAVLDIFRTASYDFLLDTEVSGVRRMTGLYSEASAFGASTIVALSLLVFCRNLYSPEMRNKIVLPMAGVAAVLTAMCTSTTAYVALVMVVLMYFWDISARIGMGTAADKRQVMGELVSLTGFALLGVILVVILDGPREVAFKLVDDMVFKKTQSLSYFERKGWNDAGIDAFFSTYGIGTGIGSMRTSNMFINVLGSTGALGTLLFGGFLIKVALIKPQTQDPLARDAIWGAKLTLAPIMIMSYLSSTAADYGALTASLFGIIIGLATGVRRGAKTTPKTQAPAPAETPPTAPEIVS